MKDSFEQVVTEACVQLFAAHRMSLRPAVSLFGPSSSGPKSSPFGPKSAPGSGPKSAPGSGPRAAPVSPRLDETAATAGLIGFEGPMIRGTLFLVSSFCLIAASRPPEGPRRRLVASSAGDWIYVRDWAKELSNQLLGRIKSKLSEHGLTFEIRTPTALTGDAVMAARNARTCAPLRLTDGVDDLEVWFDAALSQDDGSRPSQAPSTEFAKEGEIILF